MQVMEFHYFYLQPPIPPTPTPQKSIIVHLKLLTGRHIFTRGLLLGVHSGAGAAVANVTE